MIIERFPMDADSYDQALHYYQNRAIQLKRYGLHFYDIKDIGVGVSAMISHNKGDSIHTYQSIYLYKSYRGKGLYKEYVNRANLPVLTIADCNIISYLKSNDIPYYNAPNPYDNTAYKIISDFYGNGHSTRSNVYFMNHIDEGLYILDKLESDDFTKDAYCLHPFFQSDEALVDNAYNEIIKNIHRRTLILVMEYRKTANAYLSKRFVERVDEIELSVLHEVNQMLIADKIQNRKDFELYHINTHERSIELDYYFKMWLNKLGISEDTYQQYKKELNG